MLFILLTAGLELVLHIRDSVGVPCDLAAFKSLRIFVSRWWFLSLLSVRIICLGIIDFCQRFILIMKQR